MHPQHSTQSLSSLRGAKNNNEYLLQQSSVNKYQSLYNIYVLNPDIYIFRRYLQDHHLQQQVNYKKSKENMK